MVKLSSREAKTTILRLKKEKLISSRIFINPDLTLGKSSIDKALVRNGAMQANTRCYVLNKEIRQFMQHGERAKSS